MSSSYVITAPAIAVTARVDYKRRFGRKWRQVGDNNERERLLEDSQEILALRKRYRAANHD